jgi:conjugative transfer signal peptidase TraF
MRRGPVFVATSVACVTLVAALVPPCPRLIWNASASVPLGLYAVAPAEKLDRGDLAVVSPPPEIADLFARRGYLPRGVPLLKYVAAVAGQRVCRLDLRITIDGKTVGMARHRDRRGRALPEWQGCYRLAGRELFLMNTTVPDSLDGRYFGVIESDLIVGRSVPIWTDERGDGGDVWFAKPPPKSPASSTQGD